MHSTSGGVCKASKEARLQEAVDAFKSGDFHDLRACASHFSVPYFTFYRRVKQITKPPWLAHDSQRLLSDSQEEALVAWLMYSAATGHATGMTSIRFTVQALTQRTTAPSLKWLRLFHQWHPELVTKKAVGLDPKRARAFNPSIVQEYFKLLGDFMHDKGINWRNVWNMDEKGLQIGGGRKNNGRKYWWSRAQKLRYQLKDDGLELSTVIEAINPFGDCLSPGFVFAGKKGCPEWYEVDPQILIAMTENGWTSDFVCAEWFKRTFIPQALAHSHGEPVLLIYDGHGSHVTDQMRTLAIESGIHLFQLPPHTTHRLQPLDVGVFGPIQRAWQESVERVIEANGTGLHISQVVKVYMEARLKGMTTEIISKAWKKAGLNPIDPDIFGDTDYAPSKAFSSQSQLPDSFPLPMSTEGSTTLLSCDEDIQSLDNNLEIDERGLSENAEESLTPQHSLSSSAIAELINSPRFKQLPLKNQVEHLTAYNQSLQADATELKRQVETFETHNFLAQRENARLHHQLFTRKEHKGRIVDVRARVVTSAEGQQLYEEQKVVKEARERERAEREAARNDAQLERLIKRRTEGQNIAFTSLLSTLKKSDLQDLCWALGLEESGNMKELHSRVTAHFTANPNLKISNQFRGLFSGQRAKKHSQDVNDRAVIKSNHRSHSPHPSPSLDPQLNYTNPCSAPFPSIQIPTPSVSTTSPAFARHPLQDIRSLLNH